MEVDQKTDRQPPSFRYELREMNRQELLDGLDLHNDDVFDQEIDAVTDFDTDSVEHNWPWALGRDAQPRERIT